MKATSDWVQQMKAVLEQSLDQPVRIGEVANQLALSWPYLSRLFRDRTGVPPARYLQALRMERAAELLVRTDLSITEIALEVGYSSLGTFVARFKQLTGVTPRQFRRLARGRIGAAHVAPPGEGGGISGVIRSPRPVAGIYLGLFVTPFPTGLPAACTYLPAPGPFQIQGVRPGRYYLLAAAPPPTGAGEFLVASYREGEPLILRAGETLAGLEMTLREHRVSDPPLPGLPPPE
ncbi:MAG: AraC family transcriptional regulator [Bacillota bacterium]